MKFRTISDTAPITYADMNAQVALLERQICAMQVQMDNHRKWTRRAIAMGIALTIGGQVALAAVLTGAVP